MFPVCTLLRRDRQKAVVTAATLIYAAVRELPERSDYCVDTIALLLAPELSLVLAQTP
jgi:hypothetical protein